MAVPLTSETSSVPGGAERVNILAVDDNPEKLLALSALLSELHQNVVTATSGREALRALLHQEFAVILLDVNMPGMDGFETASLIRHRKSCEHTPIIFITSYADETHASRGYSLGAVDYILAPVEPEVLKTKVSVFVELFRKTAQIQQQAETLATKTRQLQKLTAASLAINSALSPDQMLQTVAALARDILGANQVSAIAAVDQKWTAAKTAVALSRSYETDGERPLLRDRSSLLALLTRLRGIARVPRGETAAAWPELAASRAVRLGWLGAPLTGRDGRAMGLLQVLDKRDGDFTDEDESLLTQLAQMSSIAIENTLNAEAREANRIKDEFLTTLSHELRTPLSAILGWARVLRSGRVDPDRTSHGLAVIERNVLAQARLIDDLLDVSRIITGKLRLALRPASLGAIVDAALETMRPAADAREISIVVEQGLVPGDDEVLGDPDRIQQVVWNLLSNAIKFTPPRGRVAIQLAREEDNFRIRVADSGRGISPEFLRHVFDRFQQADKSPTRSHGGLGIGLAIARHFVELHGGTISAESEGEGRGATFTVLLPAVAVAPADQGRPAPLRAAPLPAADFQDLTGTRVLVVEDDRDGRELMIETLRAAGAQTAGASSAAEALDLLPLFRPHVLVSDIGMPEEDGCSLVARIRSIPKENGGDVPALAVSAYAREEDRIRSAAAGFQSHLAKPFEPAELVAQVGALRAPRVIARAAEIAGGATPCRILVIEDDTDSREGLRALLEMWGHEVEVAADGTQGIEKAISGRPGIALIDIGLPELDGYAVAHRIREALGSSALLVALTGYADSQERQRALRSGFDAHLAKPINYSALSSLLEKVN
jgi:CheY-like chemotaxis protein